MKTRLIKSEQPKEFKPFKIEIECETIEDARLMARMQCSASDHLCYMALKDISKLVLPEIESQGFKI